MKRTLRVMLIGMGFLLIGCGDAETVSQEPEGDFIPTGGGSSNDQGGPGGRGSAVIDPCLGPRCERPNWEGRESIVDPLTDLGATHLATEIPSVDISAPR